jgi:hypothetical protein
LFAILRQSPRQEDKDENTQKGNQVLHRGGIIPALSHR